MKVETNLQNSVSSVYTIHDNMNINSFLILFQNYYKNYVVNYIKKVKLYLLYLLFCFECCLLCGGREKQDDDGLSPDSRGFYHLIWTLSLAHPFLSFSLSKLLFSLSPFLILYLHSLCVTCLSIYLYLFLHIALLKQIIFFLCAHSLILIRFFFYFYHILF